MKCSQELMKRFIEAPRVVDLRFVRMLDYVFFRHAIVIFTMVPDQIYMAIEVARNLGLLALRLACA